MGSKPQSLTQLRATIYPEQVEALRGFAEAEAKSKAKAEDKVSLHLVGVALSV